MPLLSRVLRSRGSAAIGGFAAAVLIAMLPGSVPVASIGGSLPIVGDELAAGDGADPNGYAFGTGSHWNVLNWGPGEVAAVPASFSMNTVDKSGRTVKKIFVSSGANPDVGSAASINNMAVSEDSGKKFLEAQRDYPLQALNMGRLRDGSLISIDFIPEWTDASHKTTDLKIWKSTDNGRTWDPSRGIFTPSPGRTIGPMSNGLRVHRRVIELADGTIMVPAYTNFAETRSTTTSIILQSTDRGKTWTMRSEIKAPGSGTPQRPGTNEVGWTYTADGRLMAVLREVELPQGEGEGALAFLWAAYSDDDGQTWTDAKPITGPDGQKVNGIYPDPVLLPNGMLLLATGRKDARALASYDGNGEKWDAETTVLANYPSEGFNGRFDGTSGNTSIESVGSNRAVHFYDQCHTWGCGAYNQQFGISAKYVGAVTPGTGRIDLARLVQDKLATITGDFAPADATHPERRPAGAVDGSTEFGAEAVVQKSGRPGEMIIKLDRPYPLDRLGLMLGHGEAQSAEVYLSADGKSWGRPVHRADGSDRALKYTDLPTKDAQYVKLRAGSAQPLTVTELELYAGGIDTFENELPFAVPRGWTDAFGSWVTDVPDNLAYSDIGGYRSSTALRLWDKWTDREAKISKTLDPGAELSLDLNWATTDSRAPFTVRVEGRKGSDPVAPWEFRLVNGAKATDPLVVEALVGSTWKPLGSLPRVIPARSYISLSLKATAESATLTVDGKAFTHATPNGAVGTLHRISFTTGDPEAYGGIYYLDNVRIRTS
ncbi:sialidase family protein [Microlunatus speluncae]|uniref:sialidase family protein n=1 Tax=Microlunatus speluncae TaxID=2594267 RepID=UPI00126651DB|nr:sialidase family protein [Microlunatus speluncae]